MKERWLRLCRDQTMHQLPDSDIELIIECTRPSGHDGEHAALAATGYFSWVYTDYPK